MPTYCFGRKDGAFVHRAYSIAACPRTIRVDGKTFRKNIACPHSDARRPGQGNGKWPIYPDACGLLPDQIAEAKEHARRSGCPTEYDQHGRPGWTDERHKQKYLKAFKMHDMGGITHK